ncbi:MAG: hypothetical protein IJV68_07635 [Clostridia bacterium]|nr:hypothetical protein [Clostridia bacterium]
MLKNKYIKLASILLMLCLITTCGVSSTFAKYTTGGTATDSARVAKWGVTVELTGDDAFKNTYGTTVQSSDVNKKVVAPGTNGQLAEITVSGTPEVAVNMTVDVDLELTGWTIPEGGGSLEYCPLVFTVGTTKIYMTATSNTTTEELEESLENAVIAAILGNSTSSETKDSGRTMSVAKPTGESVAVSTVTVEWLWDLDASTKQSGALNTDARDTELATLGTMPTISFELTVSVTQID